MSKLYNDILRSIDKGDFHPVYLLYGEEPFFLDKIVKRIEEKALQPHEETFNKEVMYGADSQAGKILSALRSFPMMATRRLVILKEAQRMHKNEWDKLAVYFEQPVESSVFVVVFKEGKKPDGRLKWVKAAQDKGIIFESKPLYDSDVEKWLVSYAESAGYSITPEAANIMVAYLGNNLGLVENELLKTFLYLQDKKSKVIEPNVVYELMNIDKDYNVFELINAINRMDHGNAHFIINQMMKNQKEHPPIAVIGNLFSHFHKLALCHASGAISADAIVKLLKIPAFFANKDYVPALRNFKPRTVYRNLALIQETDLNLKGIHHTHMSPEHLLKTLVYRILS